MDEKEAEARPVMGTIFLVYICCRYVSYVKLLRRRNYVAHAHAQSHFWVVKTDLLLLISTTR